MLNRLKEWIEAKLDAYRRKADEPLVNEYEMLEHLVTLWEETHATLKDHSTSDGVLLDLYESVYYQMAHKNLERRQRQRDLLERMHPRTQQEIITEVLSR